MDYAAPPSVLMDIPSGSEGVRRTLQWMHVLTMQGKVSPVIRQRAATLVNGFRSRDWLAEVSAIHAWVKDKIRYVRDISGVETLQTAEYTLANGFGDCDDQSVLLASLLESIGQHTRFVAVSFSPGLFSHVYVQVRHGNIGPWLGAETIINKPLGWDPPGLVDVLFLEN